MGCGIISYASDGSDRTFLEKVYAGRCLISSCEGVCETSLLNHYYMRMKELYRLNRAAILGLRVSWAKRSSRYAMLP